MPRWCRGKGIPCCIFWLNDLALMVSYFYYLALMVSYFNYLALLVSLYFDFKWFGTPSVISLVTSGVIIFWFQMISPTCSTGDIFKLALLPGVMNVLHYCFKWFHLLVFYFEWLLAAGLNKLNNCYSFRTMLLYSWVWPALD